MYDFTRKLVVKSGPLVKLTCIREYQADHIVADLCQAC